jgi:hypothetical protein
MFPGQQIAGQMEAMKRQEEGRSLVPEGDARLHPLLREMFMGADESDPIRPGRYLETPQRFGIVPTLHFWNRRDVWRSARWFVAPVVGVSVGLTAIGSVVFLDSPWLDPLVGLVSGLPVALAHGLLERYVRRRLRERRGQAAL